MESTEIHGIKGGKADPGIHQDLIRSIGIHWDPIGSTGSIGIHEILGAEICFFPLAIYSQ
jgi:hypothetical protein